MGKFGIKNIWDIQAGSNVNTDNLVTTNTTQTISAVKTFSALPQSSVAPTNAADLANKQYVDSLAGGRWYKLGYVASGHIEPNQNTTPQVIDFTNYDLRNGMFSFIVKTGISGHDFSFGFYGVAITDTSPYSVLTNSLYISNQDNTKGFYLKIERTTNQQIKLWFHDLNNTGFTVSYWGVFVKREGDLISLT